MAEQAEATPSPEAAEAAGEEVRAEEAAAAEEATPAEEPPAEEPAPRSPRRPRSLPAEEPAGRSCAAGPGARGAGRARGAARPQGAPQAFPLGPHRRGRPQRSIEERAQERAAERERKARNRRRYRARTRERRAAEGPRAAAETPADPKTTGGVQKVRQGVVVSDKADKTITVRIDTARRHRMYKKIVRTSSTLHAHDENNEAHIGDTVRLIESRPLSRTKRWRLTDVLDRAR